MVEATTTQGVELEQAIGDMEKHLEKVIKVINELQDGQKKI